MSKSWKSIKNKTFGVIVNPEDLVSLANKVGIKLDTKSLLTKGRFSNMSRNSVKNETFRECCKKTGFTFLPDSHLARFKVLANGRVKRVPVNRSGRTNPEYKDVPVSGYLGALPDTFDFWESWSAPDKDGWRWINSTDMEGEVKSMKKRKAYSLPDSVDVWDTSGMVKYQADKPIRKFETGATRDTDQGKYDYEGFFSPTVMERYAQYMDKHRHLADGSLRASDNWQAGMPFDVYMKSNWRHFMDLWKEHRGLPSREGIEDALCAILFNTMGYLHEYLKRKQDAGKPPRPV